MMFVKTGRLTLPATVADFYSDLARRHNVTPESVMAEALRRIAAGGTMPAPAVPAVEERPAPKPKVRSGFTQKQGMTEQEVARMVELHGQGLSDSAIARELGRTQPPISKRLRAAGLESHSHMGGARAGAGRPKTTP